MKETARVWSVGGGGEEEAVPRWHKFNLVPNRESGVDATIEEIWIIKLLAYEAADGIPSEIDRIIDSCTLYDVHEKITLRRASNYNRHKFS